MFDAGGAQGGDGAGCCCEEEQGEEGRVERGDDECDGGEAGGGRDEALGVRDEVAGALGALAGGVESVFEAGVLVGDQLDAGGGVEDLEVGFA